MGIARTSFIRKIDSVEGKNLNLRNVTIEDAEFLFGLRTDPWKGRFLSATSDKLQDQVNWLERYESAQDQAYCVIMDKTGRSLGCVRIYDPDQTSFCWGSWLLIDGLSPMVAMESALLVYACSLDMGFTEARLDVRLENRSVWRFHERVFEAKRIRSTDTDIYYHVNHSSILKALSRHRRVLPEQLKISYLD